MSKEVASLEELKNFCNKIRAAGGGELIEELLLSVPTDPNECLIAKNLNFDCSVNEYKYRDNIWAMELKDYKLANKITKACHLKVVHEVNEDFIILPKKISRIAEQFDRIANLFANECDDILESATCNEYGESELIEDNLNRSDKRLIQKYWPYIVASIKIDWVTPNFIKDK